LDSTTLEVKRWIA